MHLGSDSFLTSSFEEDNDFSRYDDEDDEPQAYVVGRISRGRDGEQDQVTLWEEGED